MKNFILYSYKTNMFGKLFSAAVKKEPSFPKKREYSTSMIDKLVEKYKKLV